MKGKVLASIKKYRPNSLGCQFFLQKKNYHSYPDPDEIPKITSAVSIQKRVVNKDDAEFNEIKKYDMKAVFGIVPKVSEVKRNVVPNTEVSTLDNGLTVASQELPGLMSSFSLIIGAGSSHETQSGHKTNTGVTHMIEQSGFRSTYNRTHEEILQEIENMGGLVQCITTRENIMYCIDVFRENAEQALDILADAVLCSKLTQNEIEESQLIMSIQPEELPSEIISRDTLQRAAYSGYPLAHHHYCPVDLIKNLNDITIKEFQSKILFGENCVLSGAGIDHQTLVQFAKKKFSKMPSGGKNAKSELKSQRIPSKYTGGLLLNNRALKEPFSRLALGFEIGGWNDEDLVTACVTQQLLGGGSSFSAGGPGKGMYSRIYREVLNRYHWIESAESFVSIHEESGVFGIDGSCADISNLEGLAVVFHSQLLRLTSDPIDAIELSRAKNMLKSMLLMQLESRLVLCEDISKQMVTYNKRDPPAILCEKIDAITVDNIAKFARRMFQSNPTVSCVGLDLEKVVPSYDMLKNWSRSERDKKWKESGIA